MVAVVVVVVAEVGRLLEIAKGPRRDGGKQKK